MYTVVGTCNPPANGVNTEPVIEAQTECGKNYTYYCKYGYETNNSTTATCQTDGSWSISPPTCEG